MRKRVLIANDSLNLREMIRAVLEQRTDIEICAQATNGREAFDAAMALRPDLLILDAAMPELSGIEVAGLLKSNLPETKVILFSLHASFVGERLATAAGVNVVLPKPDGILSLPGVVDSLFAA